MANFMAELDRRSLCLFVEKRQDGSRHALGGVCFFMRRDLVLTVKHVLHEAAAEKRSIFLVSGSDEGRLFGALPRRPYSHPEIDLALVQVALEGLQIDHPLFPAHLPLDQQHGAIAVGYYTSISNNAVNTWVFSAHEVKAFAAQKRERYFGSIEFVLELTRLGLGRVRFAIANHVVTCVVGIQRGTHLLIGTLLPARGINEELEAKPDGILCVSRSNRQPLRAGS